MDGRISLTLILGEIEETISSLNNNNLIDAWYLDGFSPNKNPEMWSEDILRLVNKFSHQETTFSTYTSARLVKDNLKNSGFEVHKSQGFGNKRHMLIGTSGTVQKKERESTKKIAIIGAGIAGCCLAYKLAKRGHTVDIYDKSNSASTGATGNKILVTYPRLSAHDSSYARFCLHSFLYASRFYDQLKTSAWIKSGVFLMSHDSASKKRETSLLSARQDNLIFEQFDSHEISSKAGIKLNNGGLFFPHGGYILSEEICKDLLEHQKINQIFSTKITKVKVTKENKTLITVNSKDHEYTHVCICSGAESTDLIQINGVNPKRGQISYIESSSEYKDLNFPVCAGGYLSPLIEDIHVLGSSYSNNKSEEVIEEEHLENIKKLEDIFSFKVNVLGGNVGFRAVTKDRLPLVGAIEGIYLNAGHGSRGSTSAPICAEFISDHIDKTPTSIDQEVSLALRADRFN